MKKNGNKGFTLYEFITVFGILAVITAVTVIAVNPVEYMRQSRDTQRIADLDNLVVQVAKEKFSDERTNFGLANTMYISLADTSSTCGSYTLPPLPEGWGYHCVTQENLRKTDGTGWLPVNVTSLNTLSALPLDPTNNTAYFYEAAFNNSGVFIVRAKLESDKKRTEIGAKDGGDDNSKYEVGFTKSLASLYEGGEGGLLGEGNACTYDAQCANGSCIVLYEDGDGDGYGSGAPLGSFCYIAAKQQESFFAYAWQRIISFFLDAEAAIPPGTSTNNTDCNDGNAAVWQMLSGYRDADIDGYTTGDIQQACSGDSLPAGYLSVANGNDCDDTSAAKWQLLTGYVDADGDNYTVGSAQQVCSGSSVPSGYRATANGNDCNDANASVQKQISAGYFDGDGDGHGGQTWYAGGCSPSGYSSTVGNNDDCNDDNGLYYPGHNNSYYADLGGGWDYNCDGQITRVPNSSNLRKSSSCSGTLYGNPGTPCQAASYAFKLACSETPDNAYIQSLSCGNNGSVCDPGYGGGPLYDNSSCTGTAYYSFCGAILIGCQ
jgi:hypothetical protein